VRSEKADAVDICIELDWVSMAATSLNRPDLPPLESGYYRPPGWGRTPQRVRRMRLHRAWAGLRPLLSLKPWRADMMLIVGYLVMTRVGSLSAAKLGVQIGPVPLFLTDMTLISLLIVSLFKRPGQVLYWATAGQKAGGSGWAVWMLCVAGIFYFVFAFPIYHLFAVRDLAIFAYSLFFPLTYFAVTSRIWAQRITRYFVYSGIILAVLMLIQFASGVDIGFGTNVREILGRNITYVGSDDFGGILAASLMGLVAYALLERERKTFHLAAAFLCFFAMAATGTRSAMVGCSVAAVVTFILVSHRYRIGFCIVAAILVVAMIVGAALPESVPGVQALHDFDTAIVSASGGSADENAAFRLERWTDAYHTWQANPVFGVGFGRDVLHQIYVPNWAPDKFNLGMPHNTYLFLLARAGLLGFGLVMVAMMVTFWRLGWAVRRYRQPDDLAAMNALVAMAGFAAFVLFFERPMNNAGFWIMLAVGMRLAQTSRAAALAAVRRARPVIAPEIQRQAAMAATPR
jgi:O-antigen ligase